MRWHLEFARLKWKVCEFSHRHELFLGSEFPHFIHLKTVGFNIMPKPLQILAQLKAHLSIGAIVVLKNTQVSSRN